MMEWRLIWGFASWCAWELGLLQGTVFCWRWSVWAVCVLQLIYVWPQWEGQGKYWVNSTPLLSWVDIRFRTAHQPRWHVTQPQLCGIQLWSDCFSDRYSSNGVQAFEGHQICGNKLFGQLFHIFKCSTVCTWRSLHVHLMYTRHNFMSGMRVLWWWAKNGRHSGDYAYPWSVGINSYRCVSTKLWRSRLGRKLDHLRLFSKIVTCYLSYST